MRRNETNKTIHIYKYKYIIKTNILCKMHTRKKRTGSFKNNNRHLCKSEIQMLYVRECVCDYSYLNERESINLARVTPANSRTSERYYDNVNARGRLITVHIHLSNLYNVKKLYLLYRCIHLFFRRVTNRGVTLARV